jgi:hypothetical protein
VIVYGAELNSVVANHYWPRSLLAPATEADEAVRRALAKMEERAPNEKVEVHFERASQG